MNYRIRELAHDAGLRFSTYDVIIRGDKLDIEKFAELIIQECAKIMEDEDSYYGAWLARVIKEHFGVKE